MSLLSRTAAKIEELLKDNQLVLRDGVWHVNSKISCTIDTAGIFSDFPNLCPRCLNSLRYSVQTARKALTKTSTTSDTLLLADSIIEVLNSLDLHVRRARAKTMRGERNMSLLGVEICRVTEKACMDWLMHPHSQNLFKSTKTSPQYGVMLLDAAWSLQNGSAAAMSLAIAAAGHIYHNELGVVFQDRIDAATNASSMSFLDSKAHAYTFTADKGVLPEDAELLLRFAEDGMPAEDVYQSVVALRR